MSLLDPSLRAAHSPGLARWLQQLAPLARDKLEASGHGDYPRWRAAVAQLPDMTADQVDLNADAITCSTPAGGDSAGPLRDALMQLSPWRKGPFELFDVLIDAEWRSHLKWRRVAPHLHPLKGRDVLDVGCGNGYYALRMLGAGAASVVGLDPGLLFNLQFHAINRYCRCDRVVVLPLPGEYLDQHRYEFDTVFSMGVLYHRRDPPAHLQTLHACLRPGGQLLLETLVLEDNPAQFNRGQRYANMKNVWYLPDTVQLLEQVAAAGFAEPRCVDICQTTTDEQRQTPWMTFHSLAQAIDPADPGRTIEGHPAPRRAIVTAVKPA